MLKRKQRASEAEKERQRAERAKRLAGKTDAARGKSEKRGDAQ